MNQQNVMQQQYFDPQQQASMNGFPGATGFQANQQSSSSFNGPTSATNPYMTNANNFRQNGGSRFNSGAGSEGENFDNIQSPNSNTQSQMYPTNFMDPRMSGFDPRTRPNFDPMSTGMDGFGSNSNYPNKMRMNENMAAMFNNPAAIAAFQRQRMGMFGQGREGDFMSPNNPYGGFNPQAANFLQQQRFAAFQRMQEMSHQIPGGNRNMQFPPSSVSSNQPSSTANENTSSANTNTSSENSSNSKSSTPTPVKQDFQQQPQPQSQQQTNPQQTGKASPQASKETKPVTNDVAMSSTPNKVPQNANHNNQTATNNTLSDGGNTPRPTTEQQNTDPQRNAAMLAAAAVRAAAAASSRSKAGLPPPNMAGPGQGPSPNYPFGPHGGYPQMNMDILQQAPFINQNMQSPDFGGVMSPNKEMVMAMNQGRGTPRNNIPPPPYSPSPFSNDSNHSSSGSVKGSASNLASITKSPSVKNENHVSSTEDQRLNENKENQEKSVKHEPDESLNNHNATKQQQVPPVTPVTGNPTILPATPISNLQNASPVPSPFCDDSDVGNLSPSWPNTPLSPNAQKKLKAKASPKQYDQLSKVYDLIVDEEKRNFFDRYLAFMSVNGTPVTKLPVIGKKTLDLYTLFRCVCERGGIQQVMEKRIFREVLGCLALPNSDVTLAYMVKEQYMKYLHAYELKAKDTLLKKWNLQMQQQQQQQQQKHFVATSSTTITSTSSVPTIALNDSFQPDVKPVANQNKTLTPMKAVKNENNTQPSWPNNLPNTTTSTPSNPMQTPNQFNPRMQFANQPSPNNAAMNNFNQQAMNVYGTGQEMPPGYPAYGAYQNPMFQRPPGMPTFNMRPSINDQMAPGWPRGFPPRQGPPELYPEGLQRMPWNQQSPQRHPMSAFATPNFSASKGKGKMPPISRDSMEQMKFNAQQQQQQQQLKMQKYQQQLQKQQQAQQQHQQSSSPHPQQQFNQMQSPQQSHNKRFQSPDPKMMFKGRMPAPSPHDLKHQLTPTQHLKREFTFPPNSVEATKPGLKKRRKLTSKDLGPIEAWRIMMSLKSGLVSECTWAVDTLNILLADNNTITYFHLKQLPGLLDTLMDHYRRCLRDLFDEYTFTEIPLVPKTETEDESGTVDQKLKDLWVGVCKNSKCSYTSNIASTAISGNMKEDLSSGKEFWDNGGGDYTEHIQTAFPSKDITITAFPKGILVVTKAEEEKQRKLDDALSQRKENTSTYENNQILKSPTIGSKNDETKCITTNTTSKSDTKDSYDENDATMNKKSNSEPVKGKDGSSEPPTGCMQIINDLLADCENETKEETPPIITKILQDLEFVIPCDKKYLDDSKEFIEYLNRRLQRENRGNVKSEHCVVKQSTAFSGIPDSELSLLQRCVTMSNVFRSLSFIQGNDSELANHAGLLSICAFALLHKHEHAITDHSQFKLGFEERTVPNNALSDDINDTWWESLFSIRENTLVLLANIGGHLNLKNIREDIREPLVKGLLHWIVCRSSQALDPLPTAPGSHALSAQRLCIETLAKMTINHQNVEKIMVYPTDSVLEELGDVLVKHMAKKSLVPNREFAIILVDNMAHSERFSKVLATRKSAIRNICTFLYDAEKNTSNYLSSGGRVQPGLNAEEICGTSISLLRRAVNILLSIAKLPCNRSTLTPYTEELLTLSTSQMIDTSVLALLASVLFELST